MEISINTQQLVELALFTLSSLEESEIEAEDARAQIALDVLHQYVLINNPNATQEEVIEEIHTLETEYVLNSLVNKGMIEREFGDDGEIRYTATPFGRMVAQEYNDDEIDID